MIEFDDKIIRLELKVDQMGAGNYEANGPGTDSPALAAANTMAPDSP